MLTPDWNPNRRTLRQFALLWLFLGALVGLVRAWRGGAFESGAPIGFHGPWLIPLVFWLAGVVVGIPGAIEPRFIRPVYVGLMVITFPIGWVVSHVLLGLVYYGLFTAIGLVFRLTGRDRLRMRIDRRAKTYWIDRAPRPDAAQYFKLS